MQKLLFLFLTIWKYYIIFYFNEKKKNSSRKIPSQFFELFQDLHLKENLYNYTRYIQKISIAKLLPLRRKHSYVLRL